MGPEAISLYELNKRIQGILETGLPDPVWIIGEISDISFNRNGHCYLELVEKAEEEDRILARSRATIWSATLRILKPYFETTTGQALAPGIKVMVKVTVEFHELYSISLNIRDIEPKFTLGDLARKRQQIIRKLEEAGVFDMNKGLELALVPQRIAIISSPTAAGYEDFEDQIRGNLQGYSFYLKLFPAVMQGDDTARSIIGALDRISQYGSFFDAVVIIRGGGSKLDLSSFDDFDLAYFITQFPLPVITGIGHEQDDSVVDLVAHTRCKTPTAAAEFLIDRVESFESMLDELASSTVESAEEFLKTESERMALAGHTIRLSTQGFIENNNLKINQIFELIKRGSLTLLKLKAQQLQLAEKTSLLQDPIRLLKKGYTLTFSNGILVRSAAGLHPGDRITTRFTDGEVQSEINSKES